MNKLTQQEAQDLITKAWQMVSDQNLGQYRFGGCLWNCLMNHCAKLSKEVGVKETSPIHELCLNHKDSLVFESSATVVTDRFYRLMVDNSNNQLDTE